MASGETNADKSQAEMEDSQSQDTGPGNVGDVSMETTKGEVVKQGIDSKNEDTTGSVNMEATISTDDVIRAGGFGATDDISSLLPVAMDSTDFEASLRGARDFEGPQEEIPRHGLGWTEAKATK